MIEAVLFDMDDTLYPEEQFVRSGFRAVGAELGRRGLADAESAAGVFEGIHFGEGRDRVFNKALQRLDLPDTLVPELVATYRDHAPSGLSLFPGVAGLLARLRARWKIGVVTDGWLGVQQRKAGALGIREHVDAVFFSDELGRARWKPDPAPFLGCIERLGGPAPARSVFVGDNPTRDVQGALAAGLRPVLMRRSGGYFARDDDGLPDGVPVVSGVDDLDALLRRMDSE